MRIPFSIIALSLALSMGCSEKKPELIGTYFSENPHFLKKGWLMVFEGYDGFTNGDELELMPDSTFRLSTCGNILTGRWWTVEDTLCLKYQTNRWRNDSLHQFGFEGRPPRLSNQIEKLKRRKDRLIFASNPDGDQFYHVLEKVE
jgi:hypothetical protein